MESEAMALLREYGRDGDSADLRARCERWLIEREARTDAGRLIASNGLTITGGGGLAITGDTTLLRIDC
jgi:hypothetical protein